LEKSPKKKKSKNYFTQETEDAIVRYNNTESELQRNLIYNEYIAKSFDKLAENIINTFKFSYFDDGLENVKHEVVSFMVEKISLYNQKKGKAFSYFSIVAKNYLILTNNTNYKKYKIHDVVDAMDANRNYHAELKSDEKLHEDKELINMLVSYWENNLNNIFKKQKDVEIANAIIELFKRIDSIENFNKKVLYIYIREMTDCKTQQITKVVNEMRKYYVDIIKDYSEEGVFDTKNFYENKFF
jgi:hypothetical protein